MRDLDRKPQISSRQKEKLPIDDQTHSKARFSHPYLVIFIGTDSGKHFKIKPGTMTIGRSPQADISLDDDRVSGIHCVIKRTDDTITIEDKASTNGTYIDSQKINHAHLPAGVPFQLGRSVMKIEYKNQAEIQYEQSLVHKVSIDTLSGIFNRRHFMNLASKEMAYALRYEQTVATIMIGIDDFKRINDIYGRSIGDLLIAQLADLIREKKRAEDLLGRYGGKKFIILTRGEVEKEGIYGLCERFRKAAAEFKFCHPEACVEITVSIGFHLDEPGNGKVKLLIENLIDKAEQALNMAKKNGANQTQAFS